jgi:CheY-like chemotaxis protein
MAALQQGNDAGEPFALAIMYDGVQDMDGFALAERIAREPAGGGATLFLLTATGRRGDAARCRRRGISAYLVGPITPPILLTAMRTAVGTPPEAGERPLLTRHSLREAQMRLRILLAEDNQANQRSITAMAETWGHAIVTAGDGREALLALENEPFDLVLIDSEMPEMNGPTLVAAIRHKEKEQGAGSHVPIICLARPQDGQEERRCLQAGADSCLCKPIVPQELLERLEAACAAKNAGDWARGEDSASDKPGGVKEIDSGAARQRPVGRAGDNVGRAAAVSRTAGRGDTA